MKIRHKELFYIKAIASSIELADSNDSLSPVAQVYLCCVQDLIDTDLVQALHQYRHHIGTTRFQHSLNVSYYCFRIARMLGLHFRCAARAGLLHDLFFYDWHHDNPSALENHALAHPKESLLNAQKICSLSALEIDIITKHMFPICLSFPQYAETHVICIVDKACAVLESLQALNRRLKKIPLIFRKFIA